MKRKNSRAIYTAIFGNIDSLKEPRNKMDGVDYICITDQPFQSPYWAVRRAGESSNPRMSAKLHKLLPPPEYEETIWVDGSFEITMQDWDGFVESIEGNKDLAFYKHPARNCLYQEAMCLRGYNHDGVIDRQVARYKAEGMPEHWGLWAGGVIYRKNTRQVGKIMDKWKGEIERASIRDQVSLPYVLWKNKMQPGQIPGNLWCNDNFIYKGHENTHSSTGRRLDLG